MIISLRGPSGAGKSTLARAVFMQYARHKAVHTPGRAKPLYVMHGDSTARVLVVPGHYEIGNGGVDTLGTLDDAYHIARWADNSRYDVLMEGKCMSDGTRHVLELKDEKRDVRVVCLNVDLEECIASVRARGHNISGQSIAKTARKVANNMEEFKCRGIQTFSGSRQQCLEEVRRWLGLSS